MASQKKMGESSQIEMETVAMKIKTTLTTFSLIELNKKKN
jgi:hypothetical protein